MFSLKSHSLLNSYISSHNPRQTSVCCCTTLPDEGDLFLFSILMVLLYFDLFGRCYILISSRFGYCYFEMRLNSYRWSLLGIYGFPNNWDLCRSRFTNNWDLLESWRLGNIFIMSALLYFDIFTAWQLRFVARFLFLFLFIFIFIYFYFYWDVIRCIRMYWFYNKFK